MDTRTRREKMEAMASQIEASPREAAIAQAWIDAHPVSQLTRDDIMATENERASVREVRYFDPRLGAWVVIEMDAVRAVWAAHMASSTPSNESAWSFDSSWNDIKGDF